MTDATAILIPAERPAHFERITQNIAETTPEPHHVYWMVGTDEAEAELVRLQQSYWRDQGAGWPTRLNFMYTQTTEPYMFLGSDDVLWHQGWLTAAMQMMAEIDGVVAVSDLHNPVGTLALVSRNYIDTMSGCADEPNVICHPGYTHAYSDTELFNTAGVRDRLGYCAESVVEHLHPMCGKAQWDDIYSVGQASMGPGYTLHMSRSHLWSSV